MAYCRYCGKPISDVAVVCPSCGAQQGSGMVKRADNGGFLWGLLGFFVPIAGLILYLMWRDERPRTAKAAGIGALVSVIARAVLIFLVLSLYISLAMYMISY